MENTFVCGCAEGLFKRPAPMIAAAYKQAIGVSQSQLLTMFIQDAIKGQF